MKLTLSGITGYIIGAIALIIGVSSGGIGALLALAGGEYTTTGWLLVALGAVGVLVGLVVTPVLRRVLNTRANLEFSRGAVIGIGVGGSIVGVVLVIGVVLALLAAGGSAPPGADVTNTTLSAEGAQTSSATQLGVVWNSRAQSGVDPDTSDVTSYSAEDGMKFLVIRLQLTNTGSEDIELTPRLFQVRADGVRYDYQGLLGSGQGGLSGVTLEPESSYDGWIVFSVPEEVTEATLVTNQDAYFGRSVSVTFSHDSTMEIGVAD